jgi:hypothetical protein
MSVAVTQISTDILRRIEAAEHEAWVDLSEAVPDGLRAGLGIECVPVGDGHAFAVAKIDHIQFNRIGGLGLTQTVSGDALDRGMAVFDKAGVKNWIVHVTPESHNLAVLCKERGFVPHTRTWAKFVRDASAPAKIATDLAVREVGAAYAEAFGQTAVKGFGMPPIVGNWLATIPGRPNWHCFLGFDGEMPVAAGALYVKDKVGWIGIGATLESHRGRAAQQAILAARIAAGIKAGCDIFTTETGIPHEGEAGPSFKNIQRAGLRIAYERLNLKRA